MATVTEIAPDVYRLPVFVPEFNLEFSHFLIKDDQPLLFHTGLRAMFPALREAVGRLIEPSSLRWISFSHFESDECGALNQWLEIAPQAQPACNMVGALVSVNDFSSRPARIVGEDEVLETGKHRLRFVRTPHLPHGWDAGLLFDETFGTLLCSDLFHHSGQREPLTRDDIVGRCRESLIEYQGGPFANYIPYTHQTGRNLERLAGLEPKTLAVMHGSSFTGNCAQALRELAGVFRDVLGESVGAAAGRA